MGILGVEVALVEVELEVALGTHSTKAWDSSSYESCPLEACGLVVEGNLESLFPWGEYAHTSPFEEQTWAWGIDLLPIQLH